MLCAALLLGSSAHPALADASYVVRKGDTLGAIAAAHGVPVALLAEVNGLGSRDKIRAGQVLRLAHAPPADGGYRVRPGESLLTIARAAGVPAGRLAEINGIRDPNRIRAGQVLRLPDAVHATPSSPTVRRVPSPNADPGWPHGRPIALVVHTMGGSLDGADGWFADPNSRSSAHYGVGLDGEVHQYVDLGDRAWANGRVEPGSRWPRPRGVNPNHLSVSIELEDAGDRTKPVTEAQQEAVVAIGREALRRHPSIRYLVTHRAISPQTREHDPGRGWVRSGRFAAVAQQLGLTPIP